MADVDINLRVKSDDAPVKSTALKFTELASKVQLAQQAFAVIKRVVSETVGAFTTYAKTVEDMARVTGSGAEETSRLIQVADDLQISATDLSTALAGAVRKGINPSVDSIAALSDEYLKLQPGLEQSKFLMDNFGRSGLAMARLMEQGGDSIREMGAAVDDSLVMTEDGIKAAQDYALALDTLNDRVEGAKLEIGSRLVPVLTNAATAFELLLSANNKLNDALAQHEGTVSQAAGSYEEYQREVYRSVAASNPLIDATKFVNLSLEDQATKVARLAPDLEIMTQAEWDAANAAAEMSDRLSESTIALDTTASAANNYGQVVNTSISTIDGVTQSFQAMTKELIFNAAAQNMNADEALKLGIQMGLVDASTLGYMAAMDELDAKLAAGDITMIEYRNSVAALGLSLDAIAHPYDIMVNFTYDPAAFAEMYAEIGRVQQAANGIGISAGGGEIIEARAAGGPVNAGQPYLVGENGPEIITPNRDAYVVPNGAGNVYNFYGYNNPTAIAQRLSVLEAFGV